MKELNILQAIEMPVGTEFKVITGIDVNLENVILDNLRRFRYSDNHYEIKSYSNEFIKGKFIPIQKPVSFIEALEASKEGKRLRVVHDAYCETKEFKKIGKLFEMIISANKNFGDEIVNKAIIENISNGKWYIEEE